MIIKFIPETDAEKAKHQEIEYDGVKEFLVFGKRKDQDGIVVDFHEWEGSYRYLLGSLDYFYNEINDERRDNSADRMQRVEKNANKSGFIKRGEIKNIEVINTDFQTLPDEKDQAKDANVEAIDAEKLTDVIQFPAGGFGEKDLEKFIKEANSKYNNKNKGG